MTWTTLAAVFPLALPGFFAAVAVVARQRWKQDVEIASNAIATLARITTRLKLEADDDRRKVAEAVRELAELRRELRERGHLDDDTDEYVMRLGRLEARAQDRVELLDQLEVRPWAET